MDITGLNYCGECPFMRNEDVDGWGVCWLKGEEVLCWSRCWYYHDAPIIGDVRGAVSKAKPLGTWAMDRKAALRVLHYYQKWRRGCKGKQPSGRIVGMAIDCALRDMRFMERFEKGGRR